MPILGITGSIASGKSQFTALLLGFLPGAEAFDADRESGNLLKNDPEVRGALAEEFGETILDTDYSVTKAALRKIVFEDTSKRKKLEAILHPRIRQKWLKLAEECRDKKQILLVDIPLLFETNAETYFDTIVVVACSEKFQKKRLKEKRGLGADMAQKIISTQWDVWTKIQKADFLIWNNGSQDCLKEQAYLFSHYFKTLWMRKSL